MPLVLILAVALRWLLRYAITKTILMLGVGYVTHYGINQLFEQMETSIWSAYDGLPAIVWDIATLCGLDSWISIVLSAMSAFLAIKGIQQGVITSMKFNPIGQS